MIHLTLDEKAELGRSLRDRVHYVVNDEPTWGEVVRLWLGYTAVAAGVGFAVFVYVEPAHAGGSMANAVRTVSPSIVYAGPSKIERKMKADMMRDDNRARNDSALEQQRSDNRRALEADKAYYAKLKDQRKRK